MDMANTFIEPVNGKEDTNVIAKSGGIAFDIPLFELRTAGDASFQLNLSYKSAMTKEDYGTWGPEAPSNLVGVGWGINIEDKIFLMRRINRKVGMFLKGKLYELRSIESTDNNILKFETAAQSLLRIYYYINQKYWSVFTEDGTEYVFGHLDKFNKENGNYSIATGTYTEASPEYEDIRKLISAPDEHGIPANVNADNTLCDTEESVLTGRYGWLAPTYDANAMTKSVTQWRLSHIKDSFSNVIAFSYIQHISNLIGSDQTKTYSVANYLYRISVYNSDIEIEKIVLSYQNKDNQEYNVDFVSTPRPNGAQQKFEKLYLTEFTRYSCKFQEFQGDVALWISDRVKLNSKLLTIDKQIVKRQLLEVQFLSKDTDIQYMPSYKMTYYGNTDGVSAGPAGFDDKNHLYYNASSGAVFGFLKTLTYPSGERREYKYEEHEINSFFTTWSEKLPQNTELNVIHTPYHYSIVIVKEEESMVYYVYTMTISGWRKIKLLITPYMSNYDYEQHLSYSETIIGIIQSASDTIRNICVYVRDGNEDGIWKSANGFPIEFSCELNKLAIDVSNDGVGYSYVPSGQTIGNIYFVPTDRIGHTFKDTITYPLTNLVNDGSYRVFVKICGKRCYAFGLSLVVKELPKPSWWLGTGKPQYDTFTLKAGGIGGDGKALPISDLGEPDFLNRSYNPKNMAMHFNISANYMIGTKIEKMLTVDMVGTFFVLRYKTRGRCISFRRENAIIYEYSLKQVNANGISDWCLPLICNQNTGNFYYIAKSVYNKAFKLNKISDLEDVIYTSPTMDCSTQISENGMVYTLHLNSVSSRETIDDYITIFCTYLGGSSSDFKVQTDESYKMLYCIIKDNVFAAFQAKLSDQTYGKRYMYYNTQDGTWYHINTGTLTDSSITYNKNAEIALKVLGGLGIAMFLALLPFGISSAAGLICTALSTGLFIASEVSSSILQNSLKASLNLECSYFGNRFINDGTTIWFREGRQDRLTAIGSGTSYQPYDSLNDTGILGSVITTKQQFGHVYNYVPFFTDQKRLYYRTLKNDKVSYAMALGGLSVGCGDLYMDPDNLITYAYKDEYVYQFSYEGLISITKNTECPCRCVDACCLLKEGSQKLRLLISGDDLWTSLNGQQFYQTLMSSAFPKCDFTYIDCALEVWKDETANRLYLFSGTQYCLYSAEISDNPIFQFIEKGSLEDYLKAQKIDKATFEFDKLDAVYHDKGICFIRGNRFQKYRPDGTMGKGWLGVEWFHQDIDANDAELYFTDDSLAYYNKKTGDFQLNSLAGGCINDGIRNYAVDTVSFYTDPRLENQPASITKYAYHTGNSSYSMATQTAVYRMVEVRAQNEEEY